MKRFLGIICSCLLMVGILQAQDQACIPDTSIIDSAGAIFPRPFLPDDSLGIGIQKVACINEPFEFVFTVVIPKSASLNGFQLALLGARMDTVGAIGSLPEGLDYDCFPGDCMFDTLTPGCLVIRGTPTSNNEIGEYDLVINFSLLTGIGPIGVTFPGAQFPGNYFLRLEEEGSENCGEILSLQSQSSIQNIYNAPNPFKQFSSIYLHTGGHSEMNLDIINMTGQVIYSRVVTLNPGPNILPLDMGSVPAGIYSYILSNQHERWVHKMVISN